MLSLPPEINRFSLRPWFRFHPLFHCPFLPTSYIRIYICVCVCVCVCVCLCVCMCVWEHKHTRYISSFQVDSVAMWVMIREVQDEIIFVGFKALTAVVVWNIAPCCPHGNRLFGGKYHFHIQGRKSAERETYVQRVARRFPLGWRWCVPPKPVFTYGPHGAIFQEMATFI
jgi:hypothetical protein